jgi:hypothetical protein
MFVLSVVASMCVFLYRVGVLALDLIPDILYAQIDRKSAHRNCAAAAIRLMCSGRGEALDVSCALSEAGPVGLPDSH